MNTYFQNTLPFAYVPLGEQALLVSENGFCQGGTPVTPVRKHQAVPLVYTGSEDVAYVNKLHADGVTYTPVGLQGWSPYGVDDIVYV